MACRTLCSRCLAPPRSRSGDRRSGDGSTDASSAASLSVSCSGSFWKYVAAAREMPNAPCPKYAVCKYVSRILVFELCTSNASATPISRIFLHALPLVQLHLPDDGLLLGCQMTGVHWSPRVWRSAAAVLRTPGCACFMLDICRGPGSERTKHNIRKVKTR
jgi:hypothetical protein